MAAAVAVLVLLPVRPVEKARKDAPGPQLSSPVNGNKKPVQSSDQLASTALSDTPSESGAAQANNFPHQDVASKDRETDRLQAAGDEPADPNQVLALLDNPRLRHIFFVTDQIGEPSLPQVGALIEQSTRHDYFKITVSQGIVIDPRHPEQATVFALVLDESSLASFRNRLKQSFNDRFHEDEIVPSVVTQLAEIGQVVSLPPHPIGDVYIPSSRMALRSRSSPNSDSPTQVVAGAGSPHDQQALEQERGDSVALPAASEDGRHEIRNGASRPGSSEIAASPPYGERSKLTSSGQHLRAGGSAISSPSDRPGEQPEAVGAIPHARTAFREPVIVLVWVAGHPSG
jgi:hypothetical protein